MLAKYDRLDLIGNGTFGSVYLVRSKVSGQSYVLKEVKLRNMTHFEKQQALTEVSVLSRCRHKNIIRYKEAMMEQEKGILSIIMEYAEFGDMYGAIKKQKGAYFKETDVLSWFVQITLALQYIHNHNILHRDLKTQNIFLTGSKMVKIGDFGIARVLKEDHELATTSIGTPYYLSPEICQRKPYNCKSDIWALGCVLFEMSALIHPFQGQNFHQLVHAILNLQRRELPSHCSALIQDLVKSLLRINPEERPSADEILAIPGVQPHLYRYLNTYSTPESLGIIDAIAVASLKKHNSRRFSSNDVLDIPRGDTYLKRTASASAVHKSVSNIRKSGASSNDSFKVSPSSQHLKKPQLFTASDVKSSNFPTRKSTACQESTKVPLKSTGTFTQTYSLIKKAAGKGEKAIVKIGNKVFKEASDETRMCNEVSGGCPNGESIKQLVSDTTSNVVKVTKKPVSDTTSKVVKVTKKPVSDTTSKTVKVTKKIRPKQSVHLDAESSKNCFISARKSEVSTKVHLTTVANEHEDGGFIDAPPNEPVDSLPLHCPHSHCQCCVLDMLWKNRIRSDRNINDKERLKLRKSLQTALGENKFEDIYSYLSKSWNDESIDHYSSFYSIIQKLNFDQRQLVPLLMQLLQLDFFMKTSSEKL